MTAEDALSVFTELQEPGVKIWIDGAGAWMHFSANRRVRTKDFAKFWFCAENSTFRCPKAFSGFKKWLRSEAYDPEITESKTALLPP